MKTQIGKIKLLALGIGIAFVIALLFAVNFHSKNRSLKIETKKERLNSENLLSEKSALQKAFDKLNSEIPLLKAKNTEMDKLLAQSNEKIYAKQLEIDKLIKEKKDIKEITGKMNELQVMKDDLIKQVNALNQKIQSLNSDNLALNTVINDLKNDKQQLSENMRIMAANNFLIETLKGKKEKLTVSAKKTNKIKTDFDIPVDIENNLSFIIHKPDGKIIDSKKDKSISLNIAGTGTSDLVASTGKFSGYTVKTKRANMVYQPLEKLLPGVYSIDVFNKDTYLGTSQVKLK